MWVLALVDELIGSEALASVIAKSPRLNYLIKEYAGLRSDISTIKGKITLKGLRASFKGKQILNEIGNFAPKLKMEFVNKLKEHNQKQASKSEKDNLEYNQIFISLWDKSSWIAGGLYQASVKARNNHTFGELTIWTQKGYGGYTYYNVGYEKTWLKMVADFNVPGNGSGTRFWETYLHRYQAGKVKAPKRVKKTYSSKGNVKAFGRAKRQNRKVMRARK